MKESIIFNEQNLTEKVHYVYRVIIDGKYYIGKRTGRLDDLDTGAYKTSSKLIKEKLKNGHHFSKIKIIGVFSTKEEALEYEERFLTRVDARANPKFLNQTNGNKDFYVEKHTEESKEKMSEKAKARFDENTEEGRRNREHQSEKGVERFNPETEVGRKRREYMSKSKKEFFNPNTEQGRRNIEIQSEKGKTQFDPNTERGRKNLENHRNLSLKQFDPNTEEGRKQREILSNKRKEKAKEELQKRKDASILGELMFNEDFIRENFLIRDDKNNLRFLWSVYSKLSGYSGSRIDVHKREGKLNFLYGIKSISIAEEQELAKIKEIKAIIKSRKEELSLKAS